MTLPAAGAAAAETPHTHTHQQWANDILGIRNLNRKVETPRFSHRIEDEFDHYLADRSDALTLIGWWQVCALFGKKAAYNV